MRLLEDVERRRFVGSRRDWPVVDVHRVRHITREEQQGSVVYQLTETTSKYSWTTVTLRRKGDRLEVVHVSRAVS